MFTIIVEAEGHEPKRYDFEQDEVKIGRDPGSDIHLASSNVSKRHARIVNREGRYFIVDRKSTNGTFVNGARVTTPQVLKNGDRIFVGDFVLIFEAEPELSVPTPPPIKKKRKSVEVKPATPQEDKTSLVSTHTPPPVPPKGKKEKASEDSAVTPPPPPPKKKRASRKKAVTEKMEPMPEMAAADTEIPQVPEVPEVTETSKTPVKEPAKGLNMELAASLFLKVLDAPELGEEVDIFAPDLYTPELVSSFEKHFDEAAAELNVSKKDAAALKDFVIKEVLGFGAITDLIEDETVVELFANSRGQLVVMRSGGKKDVLDGFSNQDAFALAVSRLASLCKSESAEIEDFPFVINCRGRFVAQAKLSAHGGDSWLRLLRLPLDSDVISRADVKVRGVFENVAATGARMMVVGQSMRARAEFALSLLDMLGNDCSVSFIGTPEVAEASSKHSSVSLNFSNDSLEFSDHLLEAMVANDASWIVATAMLGMNAPVLDMLSSTSKGLLWLVPASGVDKVLKTLKNLLIMQSSQLPDVVAHFIADSIDLVVEVETGSDGKTNIKSISRLTGSKSGMVTAETVF